MSSYTLGLDIGSKSIGWAIVESGENSKITNMGVRVFPEGVDRDTKGLEKSKNATRREARSARRTHQRRADRKTRLIRVLRGARLLPEGRDELMSLFQAYPYELRKKGLDQKLDAYAFGRVLYHLSQRRGFKSNRKSGKAKEDGPVIKHANALQTEMDSKGCRTLGEYFAGLDPEQQRIRERYTFRSMYLKEFDLLWAKQAEYYPSILTDDLRTKMRDEIIFFQRPLRPTDDLIGECELEPGQKRCPRGDWYALRFRIHQDVNNLVIQNPHGSDRKLTSDERRKLLEELTRKAEVSFNDMRGIFGLLETQRFNLEQEGKKTKLKGNAFTAGMRSRKAFGPQLWDAMPDSEKTKLNQWLVDLEDDDLAVRLKTEYGLEEEQIGAILKIALPRGYMSFSRAAILKLIPLMEEGKLTSEAKKEAYGDQPPPTGAESVETLGQSPDIRNPIVQKALYQVRKVVNALIREYGKPRRIKIEMAREVQGSKQQREELHWKQLDNERKNDEVRKRLADDIGIEPRRDNVMKYKLWEECGKTCPYTGRPISQESLFGANPEFQVEHILPYDRSLDDSFMNLTLCEAHENAQVKKSQTPYEAYSHDPQRFEQILERVNKSRMPYAKRRRFRQQEIDLDRQIERELNDTRYVCVEVLRYLKQLGVSLQGTRGKITSELRHQWGLDGIFSELGLRRDDDHRRHAVDALVVAVTDNAHLQRLAVSKYAVPGLCFELPWSSFRDQAKQKVQAMRVSHRVCRKVSGGLHEETNYGPTGLKDEAGQEFYAYRKKLEDLTTPMIEKIVDPVVREIVRQRLADRGIDPDARDRKVPKEVWKEPVYMRRTKSDKRVQIKRVRIRDVMNNAVTLLDQAGRPCRAVKPGSNHHIEVFEHIDERGKRRREGRVITMFEAVRRSRAGEPIVRKDYQDGKRFIYSAAINETFMLHIDGKTEDLFRVQKISSNQQIFFRHHAFGGDLEKSKGMSKKPNTLVGRKVSVDPIGRIWAATD